MQRYIKNRKGTINFLLLKNFDKEMQLQDISKR